MTFDFPIASGEDGSAIVTALAALLGVFVGAFTNGIVQWQLEKWRERNRAETAWSLLQADAAAALSAVWERRRRGTWPIAWTKDWSGVWRDSRGAIARHPRFGDRFQVLASAFGRMDQLESAVNTPRRDRSLSARDKQFLWQIQGLLERACEAMKCIDRVEGERPPDEPTQGPASEDPNNQTSSEEPRTPG
jgi:hypothetical protein